MNRSLLLFSTLIALVACHSGNPDATYAGGEGVNPGTVGSQNMRPPSVPSLPNGIPPGLASLFPGGIPSGFPGMPAGFDPSAFTSTVTMDTCADLGPNPQYHEVDLEMTSGIDSSFNPVQTYDLKITDAKGNVRKVNATSAPVLTSDGNGNYTTASFPNIHYVRYENSVGPLTLVESGKMTEIVCQPLGVPSTELATDIVGSNWCAQQGSNTLKYAFTSDQDPETIDSSKPATGTISATTYQGFTAQGPLGTQLSQVQGTWQYLQGALTLKFSDGTTKAVSAAYEANPTGSATGSILHLDFPDHRETYSLCPDDPKRSQPDPDTQGN